MFVVSIIPTLIPILFTSPWNKSNVLKQNPQSWENKCFFILFDAVLGVTFEPSNKHPFPLQCLSFQNSCHSSFVFKGSVHLMKTGITEGFSHYWKMYWRVQSQVYWHLLWCCHLLSIVNAGQEKPTKWSLQVQGTAIGPNYRERCYTKQSQAASPTHSSCKKYS